MSAIYFPYRLDTHIGGRAEPPYDESEKVYCSATIAFGKTKSLECQQDSQAVINHWMDRPELIDQIIHRPEINADCDYWNRN